MVQKKTISMPHSPSWTVRGHKNSHKYFCTLHSLKVDDEKQLHDGRNIADSADDEDGDLELLYGDEDYPKWKRAPNLFQECWKRDGKNERLSKMVPKL